MPEGEKIDNKIFEPSEKIDNTGQTEHLYAQRPIWLRQVSDVRTYFKLLDIQQ